MDGFSQHSRIEKFRRSVEHQPVVGSSVSALIYWIVRLAIKSSSLCVGQEHAGDQRRRTTYFSNSRRRNARERPAAAPSAASDQDFTMRVNAAQPRDGMPNRGSGRCWLK